MTVRRRSRVRSQPPKPSSPRVGTTSTCLVHSTCAEQKPSQPHFSSFGFEFIFVVSIALVFNRLPDVDPVIQTTLDHPYFVFASDEQRDAVNKELRKEKLHSIFFKR